MSVENLRRSRVATPATTSLGIVARKFEHISEKKQPVSPYFHKCSSDAQGAFSFSSVFHPTQIHRVWKKAKFLLLNTSSSKLLHPSSHPLYLDQHPFWIWPPEESSEGPTDHPDLVNSSTPLQPSRCDPSCMGLHRPANLWVPVAHHQLITYKI